MTQGAEKPETSLGRSWAKKADQALKECFKRRAEKLSHDLEEPKNKKDYSNQHAPDVGKERE